MAFVSQTNGLSLLENTVNLINGRAEAARVRSGLAPSTETLADVAAIASQADLVPTLVPNALIAQELKSNVGNLLLDDKADLNGQFIADNNLGLQAQPDRIQSFFQPVVIIEGPEENSESETTSVPFNPPPTNQNELFEDLFESLSSDQTTRFVRATGAQSLANENALLQAEFQRKIEQAEEERLLEERLLEERLKEERLAEVADQRRPDPFSTNLNINSVSKASATIFEPKVCLEPGKTDTLQAGQTATENVSPTPSFGSFFGTASPTNNDTAAIGQIIDRFA